MCIIKILEVRNPLWIPGLIVKCQGPVSYCVDLNNGIIVRHHVDHG